MRLYIGFLSYLLFKIRLTVDFLNFTMVAYVPLDHVIGIENFRYCKQVPESSTLLIEIFCSCMLADINNTSINNC